jgi:hypothetical protein
MYFLIICLIRLVMLMSNNFYKDGAKLSNYRYSNSKKGIVNQELLNFQLYSKLKVVSQILENILFIRIE